MSTNPHSPTEAVALILTREVEHHDGDPDCGQHHHTMLRLNTPTVLGAVTRVAALHAPHTVSYGHREMTVCRACLHLIEAANFTHQPMDLEACAWPCPTVVALDGPGSKTAAEEAAQYQMDVDPQDDQGSPSAADPEDETDPEEKGKPTPDNVSRDFVLNADGPAVLNALTNQDTTTSVLEHLADREHTDDPRRLRFAILRLRGHNQTQIANDFGVTRQAVSILRHTLPESLREQIDAAAARMAADRVAEEVLAWSRQNVGAPLPTAPGGLGQKKTVAVLGERAVLHPPVAPKTGERGTPRSEYLEVLRRFHADTGSTNGGAYNAWARDREAPTRGAVAARFGTWKRALGEARIIPLEPARTYSNRTPRETALDALRQALLAVGYPGSVTRVEKWLASRGDLPCLNTIRKYGSYNDLRHEAIEQIAATMNGDTQ